MSGAATADGSGPDEAALRERDERFVDLLGAMLLLTAAVMWTVVVVALPDLAAFAVVGSDYDDCVAERCVRPADPTAGLLVARLATPAALLVGAAWILRRMRRRRPVALLALAVLVATILVASRGLHLAFEVRPA